MNAFEKVGSFALMSSTLVLAFGLHCRPAVTWPFAEQRLVCFALVTFPAGCWMFSYLFFYILDFNQIFHASFYFHVTCFVCRMPKLLIPRCSSLT